MCASLHKAQLLGGVGVEGEEGDSLRTEGPRHSCPGSFRFSGSSQPEPQLPLPGFQHGRHKRHSGRSWPCALGSTCLVPVFQQGCVTSH